MILHVTFTDGANPVAYTGTPEKLAKFWRKLNRREKTARCLFFSRPGGLQCRAVSGGGYAGQYQAAAMPWDSILTVHTTTKSIPTCCPRLKARKRGRMYDTCRHLDYAVSGHLLLCEKIKMKGCFNDEKFL